MSERNPSHPQSTAPTSPVEGVQPVRFSKGTPMAVRLAQQSANNLQGELDQLRAQVARLTAGGVILELDPDRIRYGELDNRDRERLQPQDPELQELLGLVEEFGQYNPITVKAVADDPNFDHEVVGGRRRVAVGRILKAKRTDGFLVKAILDTAAAEDQQLAVLHAWLENEARLALSPFETGRMFAGWLKAGIFASQDAIAAATKKNKATVSQYLGLARLPSEVLDAFPSRLEISLRWYQELQRALAADAPGVLSRAKAIAALSPRLDADKTYLALIGSAQLDAGTRAGKGAAPQSNSETIKRGGRKLFEFKKYEGRYTISLGPLVRKHLDKKQKFDLERRLKACVTSWAEGMNIDGSEDEK